MPLPEGLGTLGPFRLSQKLKDAFKTKHKGKVEDQMITMIKSDVEKTNPDWDKGEVT